MKVLTIFGTRPGIIKLSLVIKVLDQHCDHVTLHTGEEGEADMNDQLFRDLEVRSPNFQLEIPASDGTQRLYQIIAKCDEAIATHKPDRVLVIDNSDSSMAAIAAARHRIPAYHIGAGNRTGMNGLGKDLNSTLADHSSEVLMPYTSRRRENLIREGIESERIFVTGNPIKEVLDFYSSQIEDSQILKQLNLKPFEYFLVTIRRAENVDSQERLVNTLKAFRNISAKFGKEIVFCLHPNTADRMNQFGIAPGSDKIRFVNTLGYFDFVKLEKNCLAVMTDSGTVQDECAILGIPNVTLRDATDRPETVECGSTILSGSAPDDIERAVGIAIGQPAAWAPPPEYMIANVSHTICKIVLGS